MLEEEDLSPADEAVLDMLSDGRVTAAFAADETGYNQQYVRDILTRLVEHGNARKVYQGLYELADDPRKSDGVATAEERMETEDVVEQAERIVEEVDSVSGGDADWKDLRESFEDYLEDRPPKTSHGKQAVLVTLEVLREEGELSTGDLKQLVFDRLETDAYDKPRDMWQSIQRYMGDVDDEKNYDGVAGIVKSGYGAWAYAGDEELRRELKTLNDE